MDDAASSLKYFCFSMNNNPIHGGTIGQIVGARDDLTKRIIVINMDHYKTMISEGIQESKASDYKWLGEKSEAAIARCMNFEQTWKDIDTKF